MSIVNTLALKSNKQIKINFAGGDLSSDRSYVETTGLVCPFFGTTSAFYLNRSVMRLRNNFLHFIGSFAES